MFSNYIRSAQMKLLSAFDPDAGRYNNPNMRHNEIQGNEAARNDIWFDGCVDIIPVSNAEDVGKLILELSKFSGIGGNQNDFEELYIAQFKEVS